MKLLRPDFHSIAHLCGSYALTRLLWRAGQWTGADAALWQAGCIALMLGILWEAADESFAGKWIFDPRGADGVDLAFDAAGAGLTLLI